MRKILISLAFLTFGIFVFAQDDFSISMTEKIDKLKVTEQADELEAIAFEFDRIIEKNDSWLPYYYASYAYLKRGRAMVKAAKLMEVDDIAAIAEKYAVVAQTKSKNSAEVLILLKMIHSLKIAVDPAKRYQSEIASGNKFLEEATKLDPKNPRISIAKAEDLYFIAPKFGGNKEKGLKIYQTALEQFKTYKPATSIHPDWGKEEAVYFISESKK